MIEWIYFFVGIGLGSLAGQEIYKAIKEWYEKRKQRRSYAPGYA